MRRLFTMFVAAAALAAGGCLQKEEIHTLYLSPDGSVVWAALEQDVHSDEDKPEARLAEEAEYLKAARRGEHEMARDLAAFGSTAVRSRILRSARPFTVLTTAEFPDAGSLFDRILAAYELPGYARLDRDGLRTTLLVHVAPPEGPDDLLSDLAGVKIVLTEGRFVSAVGFTIGEDARSANVMAKADAAATAAGGVVDLSLTWAR